MNDEKMNNERNNVQYGTSNILQGISEITICRNLTALGVFCLSRAALSDANVVVFLLFCVEHVKENEADMREPHQTDISSHIESDTQVRGK